MKWLTPLLVAAVLACGGDDGVGPANQVGLDEDFTIALGEQAVVESTDVRITFAHVLEDSRCPPQAFCVWLGNATVVLDIESASRPAELYQACTNPDICSGIITLSPFEVQLINVDPPSMPRSALDYRVTLRVTAN